MSDVIWHTKVERPVYSPDRVDNRILCTSILLGWVFNAFLVHVDEKGRLFKYIKDGHKKAFLDWDTTIIQRWAYLVDVVPLYEMADEIEREWKAKRRKIENNFKDEVDDLPF